MALNKQKSLKPLPNEIRSIVRSGIAINSVAQCVEELVYNSIDAKAQNIYVGVNLDQFNVRVDDDGVGLNEVDLESVGVRYYTSKCNTLDDLKRLSYYGFRGEALASIIEVSNMVDIITRPKSTVGVELKKKYENGSVKGFIEKLNTSSEKSGTTVIVAKLLSRLPVRQQRIDKSIQLEDVKNCLEKIALINPNLNIELRNEKVGTQIFTFTQTSCYAEAINQLYQSRIGFQVKFIQEHFRHEKFFFNLSVSSDFVKKKHYQFVFVNNRFIRRCFIHKCVGNYILDRRSDDSSSKVDKYPLFILNIECPFTEYDVTLEPKKQIVEFRDREELQSGIEGLISKLKHRHNFTVLGNNLESINNSANAISSYDVKGALHSRFVSRDVGVSINSVGHSLNDSDVGSVGRSSTSAPEKKLVTSSRNLTRTGHSTHFVDVREIRRKRKLQNVVSRKSEPVLLKPKLNPAAVKPRLTLGAFNKFPVWGEDLEKKGHTSPKQFKASKDVYQNMQKECSTSAEDKIKQQLPEAEEPRDWKMKRFFQNYQSADLDDGSYNVQSKIMLHQPLQNTRMSASSRNSIPSIHSSLRPPEAKSTPVIIERKNTTPAPACNTSDREDVESQMFTRSKNAIYNHLKDKVTFKNVKQSIIERMEKYWRITSAEYPISRIKNSYQTASRVPVTAAKSGQPVPARKLDTKSDSLSEVNSKSLPFGNPDQPVNVPSNVNLFEDPSLATPIITKPIIRESQLEKASVPPLMNLFPIQKSFSADWNDNMMSNDYADGDNDLFPSDWAVEIVLDSKGQEWLQTTDDQGKTIFINLSSGETTHDLIRVFGNIRQVTAGELKSSNPAKYNWLRRHFPRGFKKFWNGDKREITKEGDLTKLSNSTLGNTLMKCIGDQNDLLSKWNENELQDLSKYFSESSETTSVKTVNNVSSTGIQCWKDIGGVTSSFRFSREDFELIRVIGQYDKKFILAVIKKSSKDNDTLVIFDQHAVHERIRLEQLTSDSFKNPKAAKKYLREAEVMPPYQLHLSDTEVRIMQNYGDSFRQAALTYEIINSTSVKIKSVPKCFLEKCSNEPAATRVDVFRTLVHGLIQELIHIIMDTKVGCLTALPKTVHTVLCSQACRGAIKFGDVLDLDTCKELICKLRSCKNLFQCAHGRPSVVPLMKVEDLIKAATMANSNSNERVVAPFAGPCLPSHNECSKYFCDQIQAVEQTSSYFSSANYNTTAAATNTFEVTQAPFSLFESIMGGTDNPNTSATSDLNPFISMDVDHEANFNEECPYFSQILK